jgi:hypothetical protein
LKLENKPIYLSEMPISTLTLRQIFIRKATDVGKIKENWRNEREKVYPNQIYFYEIKAIETLKFTIW